MKHQKRKDVLRLFDNYYVTNNIRIDQNLADMLQKRLAEVNGLFGKEFRFFKLFKMGNLLKQKSQVVEISVMKYVGLERFKKYLAIYGENHLRDCGLCTMLVNFHDNLIKTFPEAVLDLKQSCVRLPVTYDNQTIEMIFYISIYHKFNYGLACRRDTITGHFATLAAELYRQLNKTLNGDLDRIYRILQFVVPKAPMLYIIWMHYVESYLTRIIGSDLVLKDFARRVYRNNLSGPEEIDTLLNEGEGLQHADRLYNCLRQAFQLKHMQSVYQNYFKTPRNLMKMTLLGIKEVSVTSFHDIYYLFETNIILNNFSRSVKLNLGAVNSELYNRFDLDAKLVCLPKEAPNMLISFRYFKITQFYDFEEAWMRKAKKIVAFINKTVALSDHEFFESFLNEFVACSSSNSKATD